MRAARAAPLYEPPAPLPSYSPPGSATRDEFGDLKDCYKLGRWRRGLAHSAHNRGDGGSNPPRPIQASEWRSG